MFDIKNKDIRDEKLKYAEFLLIVGGIIGSLGIKFSTPDNPALYSLLDRIIGMLGLKFLSNDMVNILANIAFVSLRVHKPPAVKLVQNLRQF